MRRSRADLPVPVGQTIKTNSPGSIRRETRRRAATPLGKTLVTSSNWTMRCSDERDDGWYVVETSWVRFATTPGFPFRQAAPPALLLLAATSGASGRGVGPRSLSASQDST